MQSRCHSARPAAHSRESSRVESNHRRLDVSQASCRWNTGRFSFRAVPGPGVEPGCRPYERQSRTRAPGFEFEVAGGRVELPRLMGTTISESRVYQFRHPAMSRVRRDGVEPPQSRTPGLRPGGLADAQPTHFHSNACPRQELNLVSDLRKVVCESGTLRGHCLPSASPPPGSRTRSDGFEDRHASTTPARNCLASSALARSRTWSATFGRSHAIRHTPRARSSVPGGI